ncbi:MAG TPA: ABC transporter substrate-binding protein [Nonomuraea sp.]|nr:ABC transporter substrate-binding protein [Nonomuraea sp.]
MTTRRAVLAAAVLLAAAGCSSQGSDDRAAVQAAGARACEQASQGVSKDQLKIGTSLPLTGGAATAGKGFEAGLKAAVAQVNEAGGIGGRRVELVVLDDGFEAARSVANIRRLGEEEKVFAVVGPAGTANLPGSFAYLERKGMPMFAPVLPPDPDQAQVWLLGTGHKDQVRVIIDWLAQKKIKTVALLTQDNDLGEAFAAAVDEQAPKHNIKLVASEKLEPNSTDVDSAILKLKGKNPDAVISGTDNAQTALLLKEARALKWSPLIIGNSSSGGPGSASTVGPAGPAAEGFYSSAILEFPTSGTPEVQRYRAAIEKAGGAEADNSFALQDYASAQVFFELIKRLGDDVCWSTFNSAAEKLADFKTGLIPPVSFGSLPGGHSGTKGARIAQYTHGKWTALTEFREPQA